MKIQSFLDEVIAQNPSIASSYIAGKTHEKRNLRVLVLKTATSKRAIWIDCGIHAREWISPATCIWTINKVEFSEIINFAKILIIIICFKLVTEYNQNDQATVDLLNRFEFHILPILNPG